MRKLRSPGSVRGVPGDRYSYRDNRRETVLALFALGAASVPFASRAQKKDRLWRVGVVWGGSKLTSKAYEEAFLTGMKGHGYEVGGNLIVDSRYSEGDPGRYPALVEEVMALRPDALIGANTGVARLMKSRTATVPIVLGSSADPVGQGLAQSLARPGATSPESPCNWASWARSTSRS